MSDFFEIPIGESYNGRCPYGYDEDSEYPRTKEKPKDEIEFAPQHHQKILDRTKIRTARKQDKSGEFTIKGERFKAEFEIAMTIPAFMSLLKSGFYTPEQFGWESIYDVCLYYKVYFKNCSLAIIHKISKVEK